MLLLNTLPITVKYAVLLFVPWVFIKLCYSLLFHPLRKFPGPFLAKFTDAYHGITAFGRQPHLDTYQNLRKYGSVYREGPNRLVFDSLMAIEDIFFNPHVTKGPAYRQARWLDKPNLFDTQDKEQHREKRQIVGRVLSDQTLRTFQPIIGAQVNIFIRRLLKSCQDGESQAVNMSIVCKYLATDVIGYVSFGHAFKTQTEDTNHFYPNIMRRAVFTNNIYYTWPALSIFIPILRWLGRNLARNFHRAVEKMILARIKKGKDHTPDFYSMVTYDADEKDLLNSELWTEALFFLSAGGTTVASAQCGLFFNLTQHREVYDRLAAEIRQTFSSARDIQIGPKLAGCKYLRAVIDESLRLSPPSLSPIWRQQEASSTEPFLVDGHVIPPEQSVLHNPEYFPEPFAFRPERWLESEGDEKPDSQMSKMRRAQVSFGVGDRSCAGKSMALFEASLVIARALWYFDFERAPGAAGMVGAGTEKDASRKPWAASDQLQLDDILVADHDGPNVVFKPRGEFWRDVKTLVFSSPEDKMQTSRVVRSLSSSKIVKMTSNENTALNGSDASYTTPLLDQKAAMSAVSRTSLMTLSARSDDARRPKPILRDTWSVHVLDQIGDTFPRSIFDNLFFRTLVLRCMLIDRWTCEFLDAHPEATVLHLACGLDARSLRVKFDPLVRWIDVDVPSVVSLRQQVLPQPQGNYRLVAASVLDPAFLDTVPNDQPTIIIMEGLLPYLSKEDVYRLMGRLAARFPRGQILFDICGLAFTWLSRTRAPGLKAGALMGFVSDNGNELADVSPKLSPKDNLKFTQYPGHDMCPWYMRLGSAILQWIPRVRAFNSACRFEIREVS
ncbi:Cytochrome P450 monooxygenase AKT7-like protein [Cladobotryum mycophilum]|uniref:Cytochrome P450 monooxygenase AKT7-like protein n=1 Tax=Cladobotryum mycophilum TaxID=491253 RepID=A0ABR0S8T0_9HYPO